MTQKCSSIRKKLNLKKSIKQNLMEKKYTQLRILRNGGGATDYAVASPNFTTKNVFVYI